MAPLRRYLRITKHSVLEVRIYLDRPADAEAWLLRRDNPALPRVIQAVRPLVLPKLREENERANGRGGAKARKRGVKDVVSEEDFEVSIFLTDLSSRHSVLIKQKRFKERPRIESNSGKLTSWLTTGTSEQPMVIPADSAEATILRQEDDELVNLDDIPEGPGAGNQARNSNRSKRRRGNAGQDAVSNSSNSDEDSELGSATSAKRTRRNGCGDDTKDEDDEDEGAQDDNKKLGLNTSYDGFSIYGHILCLVIKRKGPSHTSGSTVPVSSQQMLENWVSTQAAAEADDDEDNA